MARRGTHSAYAVSYICMHSVHSLIPALFVMITLRWHATYIDALQQLFDASKAEAGEPEATLEIW